jgi:glycosyltransferase involved in cell wall biosynthesis
MKLAVKILDVALAGLLAMGLASLVILVTLVGRRKGRRVENPPSKRSMRLFASHLEAVDRMNITTFFCEDYDKYFDHVYTVFFPHHPCEAGERSVNAQHTVIQQSQHPPTRLFAWGLRKTNSLWAEVTLLWTLYRRGKEEGVHLVYAQDPHLLGLTGFVLAKLLWVPFVLHIIQNYDISARATQGLAFPPFRFQWLERGFERFLLRRADLVLGGWDHHVHYALAQGAPLGRTHTLRIFAEEDHYKDPSERRDIKQELGLEGKTIIFTVGRLHPVKYPEDLLYVLEPLLAARKDVVFCIAGDGVARPKMEALCRELGIKDQVRFLGVKTQQELVDLYATTDVVAFTHAGTTLLEAALAGAAIIAYDHDWAPDFLGCDERGLIVPFRDLDAFRLGVERLLDDPDLRENLGGGARLYALEHFNKPMAMRVGPRIYEKLFTNQLFDRASPKVAL